MRLGSYDSVGPVMAAGILADKLLMSILERNRLPLLLLLIGLLAYWNAPLGQYCYDDTYLIRDCRANESWSNLPKLVSPQFGPAFGDLHYRPVAPLTFFVDSMIFHKIPFFSRLINLALHLSLGLLLFALWRRLFGRELVAFVAAAFFLCHPITSEVVDCPGFRKDLLSTLFTLWSLWLLLGLVTRWTVWRGLGAAGVWLVGLLSKEPTFMLLLLAPMLFLRSPVVRQAWRPFDRVKAGRVAITAGAFAIAFALFLGLYLNLSYRTPTHDASSYRAEILKENPGETVSSASAPASKPLPGFLNFARTFHLYLRLWAVPVGLSNGHYFVESTSYADPRIWVGVLLLFAFAGCSLYAYVGGKGDAITNGRLAGVGGMWVCICLLPIAQILPTPQILAERYVYMAHAGMALVFAAGLAGLRDAMSRTRLVAWRWGVLVAALLAACIVLTSVRNRDWYDDVTLNIRRYEQWDNAQGYLALGALYYGKGDLQKAAGNFLESIRRDPNLADAQRDLGIIYVQIGKLKEARAFLEKAAALDPKNGKNAQAMKLLGKMEAKRP